MAASFLHLPERFTPERVLDSWSAEPGQTYVLAELDGPGCIRHIWVGVRPRPMANRLLTLRIFWDGEAHPSVEVPLGDFFGLCHGIGYYAINSLYLSVQEQAGYNSYFPMPFARSARIELDATGLDERAPFFYHVDWHRYRPGALTEGQRFHAAWRREFPTQPYADEYLMLDAVGRGRLLGFVLGVRLYDDVDRWSHGGAETIYVDGEATGDDGVEPAHIRGSGGEDAFGTSFGGALHRPETHLYEGIPYYVHEDVSMARPAQRLAGYRFFEHDAIAFERSLHFRFGCMTNDLCSTVYWYQEPPHRPFVRLPEPALRLPGTELRRGAMDLPLDDEHDEQEGEWWLCGPFEDAGGQGMARALPPEEGALPDPDVRYDGGFQDGSLWLNPPGAWPTATLPAELRRIPQPRPDQHLARWVRRRSIHGFVDFAHVFRPRIRGVRFYWPAVASAQTTLSVDEDTAATLHIAWDDRLVVRLNDEPPRDLGEQVAFRRRAVPVRLRRGANRLLLKLSNTKGRTWGAWCFTCRVVLPDGSQVIPHVA
jgi:hypothetical protein